MSIETDFQALLEGYAPLVALVDESIAQDAVPEGMPYPLALFGAVHSFDRGLDNSLHGDTAEISAQAWADDPEVASAVADAIEGVVATVPDNAITTSRASTYEPELKKHGVIVSITWIA